MPFASDPYAWVESVARTDPQRLFLTTPAGLRLTYSGLRAESDRFAAALTSLGVVPGDRIAVQVEKSPESVLLYIACLRLGAAYVPINTANTARDVEYFLGDAAPRLAVVRPADLAQLAPLATASGVSCVETLGACADGSLVERARASLPDAPAPAALAPTALAAIVYTSGTTGRSKGAMLTRGNLASNAATLAAAWRFTERDVLLHALPLFHVHGLFAAINTVLASGSSIVLLPGFDAAETLQLLPQATVFMGVPTYYTRLLQLEALNRAATARIRLFVSGSAPLLVETHREFEQRTGHVILERYGMTETLMNTSNPYDGARLPGSVGPPLPGVEVRVADAAGGSVASEPDATGMLEVRGPNVFAGYWRDAEKTCQEFSADGWFRTGDLGRIDRNGYVHIVGRVKDLVISGGYNVYPKEVEDALDSLPGILESAVIGVPHPDFGEGVTAVVVARPGAALSESAIIKSARERMAGYKLPKRVLIVDALPRNTMGKVQKNVLREKYAALFQSA